MLVSPALNHFGAGTQRRWQSTLEWVRPWVHENDFKPTAENSIEYREGWGPWRFLLVYILDYGTRVHTGGAVVSWSTGLVESIATAGRAPVLLVACDYDGTLAPIVEDPGRALPLPHAVTALRALSILPSTTVAVVSGRALRDLALLSRLPSEIHLIGSHGGEFDHDFELNAHQRRLLDECINERDS